MMLTELEARVVVTVAATIATVAYFGLRGPTFALAAIVGMFAWLYTAITVIAAAASIVPLLLTCSRSRAARHMPPVQADHDEIIDAEFEITEVKRGPRY